MAWILTVTDSELSPPRVWAVNAMLPLIDVLDAPAPTIAADEEPDPRPVIPRTLIATPYGVGGVSGPAECWRFDDPQYRDAAIALLASQGYTATPVEVGA